MGPSLKSSRWAPRTIVGLTKGMRLQAEADGKYWAAEVPGIPRGHVGEYPLLPSCWWVWSVTSQEFFVFGCPIKTWSRNSLIIFGVCFPLRCDFGCPGRGGFEERHAYACGHFTGVGVSFFFEATFIGYDKPLHQKVATSEKLLRHDPKSRSRGPATFQSRRRLQHCVTILGCQLRKYKEASRREVLAGCEILRALARRWTFPNGDDLDWNQWPGRLVRGHKLGNWVWTFGANIAETLLYSPGVLYVVSLVGK